MMKASMNLAAMSVLLISCAAPDQNNFCADWFRVKSTTEQKDCSEHAGLFVSDVFLPSSESVGIECMALPKAPARVIQKDENTFPIELAIQDYSGDLVCSSAVCYSGPPPPPPSETGRLLLNPSDRAFFGDGAVVVAISRENGSLGKGRFAVALENDEGVLDLYISPEEHDGDVPTVRRLKPCPRRN